MRPVHPRFSAGTAAHCPWKLNPHRPGWHGGIHALVFQDVFRKLYWLHHVSKLGCRKKNLSTCQRPGSEALSHATNGALRPSSPVRWLVVPAHRSWHIATKTKSSLPSEFTVLTILVVPCPLITAAIFPLFEASKLCSPEGLLIQQWLRLSRFGCDVMCS